MGSADEGELSPSTHFDVTRHGFNREQVQQHVAMLEGQLRLSNSDRDAALSQLSTLTEQLNASLTEAKDLRQRLDELTSPEQASASVHERLRASIQATKAETAEITARAQQTAERTWESAHQAADQLRQGYEQLLAELKAGEAEMRAAHAASLERTSAEIERMVAEVEQRRSELGEQAEREYQRVEREFEESMTLRRSALDTEISERQEASTAEAQRVVREATDEADRRIAIAHQKARELAALRAQVSERLRDTSQLLARGTMLLEPDESEAELLAGTMSPDGSHDSPPPHTPNQRP